MVSSFYDATSAAGGYIQRTADESIFTIMDKAQWAYAIFDAGCWGYASVTISTLAPLVFVRRIKDAEMPLPHVSRASWEAAEGAVISSIARPFTVHASREDGFMSTQGFGRGLYNAHLMAANGDAGDMLMDGFEYGVHNSTGDMGRLNLNNASGTWVMMVAVSTLLAGIACPIVGAIADRYAARKAITFVTAALSIVFMTIFAFTSRHSDWQEILAVIGLGMMFTSIMHCFYNSLLMMVSGRHDMIKVACLQCMVGSWGSAILMISLGMGAVEGDNDLDRSYILYCFILSALWFIVLAVPMWIFLEEPSHDSQGLTLADSFAYSWADSLKSLQNVELMKYLLALMLFNDSNSTLHAVYMVYGAQIGLPISALLIGAVFNRVVGGVAALAWLGLSQLADARLCFMGCIVTTILAIAVCAWMTSVTEFYIVVLLMTVASSGSFIFSKVLMAMLTPKYKASHNFGFMGMINRVAGFVGPFLFSALSLLYSERAGFIGLILMALAGLVVITMVDFDVGYAFSDSQGGSLPSNDKDADAKEKEKDVPQQTRSV